MENKIFSFVNCVCVCNSKRVWYCCELWEEGCRSCTKSKKRVLEKKNSRSKGPVDFVYKTNNTIKWFVRTDKCIWINLTTFSNNMSLNLKFLVLTTSLYRRLDNDLKCGISTPVAENFQYRCTFTPVTPYSIENMSGLLCYSFCSFLKKLVTWSNWLCYLFVHRVAKLQVTMKGKAILSKKKKTRVSHFQPKNVLMAFIVAKPSLNTSHWYSPHIYIHYTMESWIWNTVTSNAGTIRDRK